MMRLDQVGGIVLPLEQSGATLEMSLKISAFIPVLNSYCVSPLCLKNNDLSI